ncbi:MAG: hypothetical protein B7Z58_17715 [Acidiphilium sp. 37-64-53]|uniref:hypothetical protein n=1 Tax=unclassified Acidiphilium TaxID=2617493 RepID=UPI000BC7FD84|nr:MULTISPECIES: hypothetical protein [unclassified Acidiphilium]OYV99810.1 MAG: hypothetical protein B7Z58_17715 [Acidiphilium sp. 37-64-53]OZB22594.1 MAG: hypothetical protein B7X49_16900 [Acidiphilium sp. 34-64-41]HQT89611.1 hypothetical protein [Acidiphilium sp.]
MTQNPTAEILPDAIESLIHAAKTSTGGHSQNHLAALARGEPLPSYRVEDWLCNAGCHRLFTNHAILHDWPDEGAYPLPRNNFAMSGRGVTAARFVAYLIKLHRLGIDAGAKAAITALRPTLAKRKYLTAAELHVWWGPKEMDRFEDALIIQTDAEWDEPITVVGNSGHTLSVVPNRDGRAILIGHGVKPSRRKMESNFWSVGFYPVKMPKSTPAPGLHPVAPGAPGLS